MGKRVLKLKAILYAPTAIALLRVIFTVWMLAYNPQGMTYRYAQLIPVIVLLCYTFMYHKLYSDGVPVISVLAPTMLHFLVVWVFTEHMEWIPFIAPIIMDIIYLFLKSFKASYCPFIIEGEEGDKLDELIEEVGTSGTDNQ